MPSYTHVILFDEAELTCRMVEAFCREERPVGASSVETLSMLDPEVRAAWLRVAETVRCYLSECMGEAQRVQ
jgi:hypothetical protein